MPSIAVGAQVDLGADQAWSESLLRVHLKQLVVWQRCSRRKRTLRSPGVGMMRS
jgi:hypothetical protein